MSKRPNPSAEVSETLNMDKYAVDDSLWIVKVPRFLMDHLNTRISTGASLGTVSTAPLAPASSSSRAPPPRPAPSAPPGSSFGATAAAAPVTYTLALPEEGTPAGLPREYEFRFSMAPPATYVVSRGGEPKDGLCVKPQHEGRAAARCELRPRELTSEYRSFIKERGDKADAPRRAMGIVVDDRALKREKLNHQKWRNEEKAGVARKIAEREKAAQKRQRPQLANRELKEELKRLFAKQVYWSRNDLVAELGHSQQMGQCLDELCVKITGKGNPRYGDYRLKDSLRAPMPDAAGASASGAPSAP